MKKTIVFIFLLFMSFLCGCGNNAVHQNKISVVCTVFPQYDFVREIAGDTVSLSMLLPPGGEAHSYEPSPKDIITLKEAELFIAIGGESEHWAMHLTESEDMKDINILTLMDKVTMYTEEHTEGMENSGHSHNHTHSSDCNHDKSGQYDEHIWTSPENAVIMCREICDALIKLCPENKQLYTDNTNKYIEKLKKLSSDFSNLRRNSTKDTIVFGDRFPMRYLTEEMKLNYYAAFPGCSSKTEPSVNTVIFLTSKIKEKKIPVIFYMDYGDGRTAHTIARECSIKTKRLYSCHNLSKEDFENGETYLSLMTKNYQSIKEALK